MIRLVLACIVLCALPLFTESTLSCIRDCQDVQEFSNRSGVYTIFPSGLRNGVKVWCGMETDGGGWTTIQRRISASDFNKTWIEYQEGFGNVEDNYWLGNEYIHKLSISGSYQLRVDLSASNDNSFAIYNRFWIEDAKAKYKLFVDGFHGPANDSLSYHIGYKFTTKDQDNGPHGTNCAVTYKGAWWYNTCHRSNLNGEYGNTALGEGPVWNSWKGMYVPMTKTDMKLRRL